MRRLCVRVQRDAGERTRQALEAEGHRAMDAAIDSDGEYIYIPVSDPSRLEDRYDIVEREVEPRAEQTMPEDLLGFTPTYERLGDLVLLQESDPERAEAAAAAFIESDLPVTAVLNRASDVEGDFRVAQWDLLEGDHTETVHREYGVELLVDPTKAYFSPRLATERRRVIEQVEAGEHIVDMFAGVGPFAIRAAVAGAEVVAVDLNPDAVEYCRENARRNGVDDRVTVIEGDIRDVAADYEDWANRLIMNLPHTAEQYLDAAAVLAGDVCRLHYYDIQPESATFAGETEIRDAFEPRYRVSVAERHIVRSYAPGVLNVCLDVDVTID